MGAQDLIWRIIKMRFLQVYLILVFCVFLALAQSGYCDIGDGLISVWSLDEGSGMYTEDQAGENHGVGSIAFG